MNKINEQVTPQGVVYSRFFERVVASVIDGLIVSIILLPLMYFRLESTFLFIACTIIPTIVWISYYYITELKYGASPGKKLLGLKIVKMDLSNITQRDVLVRNAPFFSFEILFLIGSLIAISSLSAATMEEVLLANKNLLSEDTIRDAFLSFKHYWVNPVDDPNSLIERSNLTKEVSNTLDKLRNANPLETFSESVMTKYYVIVYLVVLFNKKRRTLHDYLAGTVVINTRKTEK